MQRLINCGGTTAPHGHGHPDGSLHDPDPDPDPDPDLDLDGTLPHADADGICNPDADATDPVTQTPAPPPVPSAAPEPALPAPAAADDARAKAAAVLQEADAASLADFEKGIMLTGGERVDWWTGNGGDVVPVRLARTNIKAFNDADKLLTVDTEPPSISAWRDTFGSIPGDVQKWFDSDTGQGYDPALRAKVEADFAAADEQIANVAAGK